MPEAPVQGVVIEDAPIPQGVPLREGEERHAATLNVEDARRKESELETLREMLAKLGVNLPGAFREREDSPAAMARKRMIKEKVDELKRATERQGDNWVGPCAPATVVNFNPLRLSLKGALQNQSVPPAGKGKVARFPFKGRTIVGSYVTMWNAQVWPVCIGTENHKGVDTPSFKADYISPLGIAHQFYSHYVEGSRDAEGMGGVLIFAGDAHSLDPAHQKRSGGMIRVPVPDPELSGPVRIVYRTETRSLEECLESALMRQKNFAEAMIAEGHRLANSNSPDERMQQTSLHVMWHNWAISMGYKREPEKWAAAQLQDRPDVDAVFCPGCHQQQKSTEQAFCPNCNRPFDAYKAFMDGHPVPKQYLELYEGQELKAIIGELKRRAATRAMLEAAEEPKKTKEEKKD